MEEILEYIKQTYNPLSIILYGSYANGTNDPTSDFDSLVISHDHPQFHDTSFVNGIQLDVFIYPASYFDGDYDCNDFIQIFDGKILADRDERGKTLQEHVLSYLQNRPQKSQAEIDASIDWCRKMLARAKRCDAEGLFRWHWVLTDSLEIFCDVMHHPYWGPKKALKWMSEMHPTAFACYQAALAKFSIENLENWISCIQNAADTV
ncbi:MAG: nucleotidyltransferase domain-containing protein [Oscillospiraceae bacterium]|nr:nucleotidyltransferase domain-containing protein [Oscillospiraceae bacterium]